MRSVLRAVLTMALALTAVPLVVQAASADEAGTYSWTQHEEGASGPGTTYTWTGTRPTTIGDPENNHAVGIDGGGDVNGFTFAGRNAAGHVVYAQFWAPHGQVFEAGGTYPVTGVIPSGTAGYVDTLRDGLVCGRTTASWQAGSFRAVDPVVGTVSIDEMTLDQEGRIVSLRATYQLNCQQWGGMPGIEGSIAFNSSAPPSDLPVIPPTPPAVTDLTAVNSNPHYSDGNTSTLTWTNPPGITDVDVDVAQHGVTTPMPAEVGAQDYLFFEGTATSYTETSVFASEYRIYRITTRGPTGRIGAPAVISVKGTYLNVLDGHQRVQVGHAATFHGQLVEADKPHNPTGELMQAPPVAGKDLRVCRIPRDGNGPPPTCLQVAAARTGKDGQFSVTYTPVENSLYAVSFDASPDMLGNEQFMVPLVLTPDTDLTATRSHVSRHRAVRFTTSRATRASLGVVWLQRYDHRHWHTILHRSLGVASSGTPTRLLMLVRHQGHGRHLYRVVKPGDAHHGDGFSRTVVVQVR